MHKKYLLLIYIFFNHLLHSFAQHEKDLEIITERIHLDYLSNFNTESNKAEVNRLLMQLNANGSWSDIKYDDHSQTNWSPVTHLKRIGLLSKAYTSKTSDSLNHQLLIEKIHLSIQYWIDLMPEPYSTNWWYSSISIPQEVGNILINLRFGDKKLDQNLENKLLKWMHKSVSLDTSPGKDGSNLTDICQHLIMRACLTNDIDLLRDAVSRTSNSIFITEGEGIQKDYSFRAHGPQLYIYGYGREYISGIRNIAAYTKGTSFEISSDKIAIISNFVRKGFAKTSRGKFADFNAFGRGISRLNATLADSDLIEQVKNFDQSIHENEYNLILNSMRKITLPTLGIYRENIHYWRSDYSIHHRPHYMFSVNAVSSRTVKTEIGNGENIRGHYLSDGSNFIAVNGNEYFNIFPVWDWNKIPGTTIPQNEIFEQRKMWGFNPGKTAFVGGVSDGIYGISVFELNDYESKAKKAWFFFENEIVALGAGIESHSEHRLNTTINQSHLQSEVVISQEKNSKTLPIGHQKSQAHIDWVWHAKVGYFFLDSMNLNISQDKQVGSWSSINNSQDDQKIELDVFKMWIDHGKKPKNSTYAYVVIPGVEDVKIMENYKIDNLTILSNSNQIQAVKNQSLDLIQMAFYEKSTVSFDSYSVKVSHPCLLMIKLFENERMELTLSEPTQLLQDFIQVEITNLNSKKSITSNFYLPQGAEAGSSTGLVIKFSD